MKKFFPCKVPEHQHWSKIKRDKCVNDTKIKAMRENCILKSTLPLTNQSQIVSTSQLTFETSQKSRQEEQSESDITSEEDEEAVFIYKNMPLSVNYMIKIFDQISKRKSGSQFLRNIVYGKEDEDYLIQTDHDPEWIPHNHQFKNWIRQLNQEKQYSSKRSKAIRTRSSNQDAFELQLSKRRIRARRKREKVKNIQTKSEIGLFLQNNPAFVMRYGCQDILKKFPTQIPLINLEYRMNLKEKFNKIEDILISLYLDTYQQKGSNRSTQIKQIRSKLGQIVQYKEILEGLLNQNIYDPRKPLGYHFRQIQTEFQFLGVQLWLLMKDLPVRLCKQNEAFCSKFHYSLIQSWAQQVLPKYFLYESTKSNISKPETTTPPDFYEPDKPKIKVRRIEKYYRNWQQLAHQLGEKYRAQKRKNSCKLTQFSAAKTACSESLQNKNYEQMRPWKQTMKLIYQQREMMRQMRAFKGLYTRIYFRKYPIYYISPFKQISLYQQVYDLVPDLDPICECGKPMQIGRNDKFISYHCNCGHQWQNNHKRVTNYSFYGVKILSEGIKGRQVYPSIQKQQRNNFHLHSFTWLRRAKYSSELPYKLKSTIPQFSDQTNMAISYNRDHENYLPLQICPSIIDGAGKGIKATKDIKCGSLILTYTGEIKPHYQVQAINDCIFSLGTIKTKDNMAIAIDPTERGNAAKYINTSYGGYNNCRPQLGIYRSENEPPEPVIILVATKNIKANQEIFYDYGSRYGRFSKQQRDRGLKAYRKQKNKRRRDKKKKIKKKQK